MFFYFLYPLSHYIHITDDFFKSHSGNIFVKAPMVNRHYRQIDKKVVILHVFHIAKPYNNISLLDSRYINPDIGSL